jgi:hypothetical protein
MSYHSTTFWDFRVFTCIIHRSTSIVIFAQFQFIFLHYYCIYNYIFITKYVAYSHHVLRRLTDYNSRSIEFLVFSSSSSLVFHFCYFPPVILFRLLFLLYHFHFILVFRNYDLLFICYYCHPACKLMYVYVSCVSCPSSLSCLSIFIFIMQALFRVQCF